MGAKFDRDKWLDWHTYYDNIEQCKNAVKLAKANDDVLWDIVDDNISCNLSLIEDVFANDWIDEAMYGKYQGPVLVCGAGPSLPFYLPAVKEKYLEGVPVIAVDRAFRLLKANGIKPMLTVSVDPQMTVRRFYDDIEPDDTVALSFGVNMSTTIKAMDSNILWFAPMHPVSPFWGLQYVNYGKKIATVRPGGVVGYSAVDIAIWCGFDMIVSIGNDFSWKYDDFSETVFFARGGFDFINLKEEKRFTIKPFQDAANTFSYFPHWHPEVEFIDASDGIIKGWKKQLFYSKEQEVVQ